MRRSLRQIIRNQPMPRCANCNVSCLNQEMMRAFSDPLDTCSPVSCESEGISETNAHHEVGNRGGTKRKHIKDEVEDIIEIGGTEGKNKSERGKGIPKGSGKITTVSDALLKVFSMEWKAESDLFKSTFNEEDLVLCRECSWCLSQLYQYYSKFTQDCRHNSYLHPVVCHNSKSEHALHVLTSKIPELRKEEEGNDSSSSQLHVKTRRLQGSHIREIKMRRSQPCKVSNDNEIRIPESIFPGLRREEPAALAMGSEYEESDFEPRSDAEPEAVTRMRLAECPPPRCDRRRRHNATAGKRGPHRKVKCSEPECGKEFLYHWLMNNHVQMDHEKRKPSQCAKCYFLSFDPDIFESHFCMGSNAEAEDHEKKHLRFHCGFCNQPFSSKSSLIQHSRIHDRSIIKCSFMNCHRTFLRMSHLEKHERILHGAEATDAPYPDEINKEGTQCSECGKLFSSKQTFKIHMEIHSAERKYLCNHCGMSFKQRRALARHNLIHRDLMTIRLHKCALCHKSFKRRYNLTQHYHSKLHPKSVVEKLMNGEELLEDDLTNSTLRRTRVVKKRNGEAEAISSRSPKPHEGEESVTMIVDPEVGVLNPSRPTDLYQYLYP